MILYHQRKISLITLALYWPALIIFAHMPVPASVRAAHVSDKCLHFLAYLVLTFLVWFSIKPQKKVNWRKLPVWLIFFGLTAYGAIDEVVQSFIGRNCDVMDLVTNITGILFCLLLLTFLSFEQAALLVSGIVIFGIANVAKTNLAESFPLAFGLFHFFAYSILTSFWILNIYMIFSKNHKKLQRFIISIGIPLCFLVIVKVSSFFLGKEINSGDFIVPMVAIITIAAVSHFMGFLFYKPVESNR